MSTSEKRFRLELQRDAGYRFEVRSESSESPTFVLDEGPPLGEASGPAPTELLGAAVGGCLSASLLYCLGRDGIDVDGLRTWVEGTVERNEEGRLRITGLDVTLEIEGDADAAAGTTCAEEFEDFCTVTESVRRGIPVSVGVRTTAPAG